MGGCDPSGGSAGNVATDNPDDTTPPSDACTAVLKVTCAQFAEAYIKASNTGGIDDTGNSGDRFGYSVALSGDTLVVGADQEDSSTTGTTNPGTAASTNNSMSDSGAVYVFTRSGTTWSQQAYLKASNAGANDRFGSSVALSDDTLAVGAPGEDSRLGTTTTWLDSGAVYLFTRSGGTWSEQSILRAPAPDRGSGDSFGTSVALSGDTLAVGADQSTNSSSAASGKVYVFIRSGSGTSWSRQTTLRGSNPDPGDYFGFSVALSGNTLAVGAYGEDSDTTGTNPSTNNNLTDSGAAYVFTRSGATWSQQAYLKASNTGDGDRFGTSVALSGDTLAVGANREDSATTGTANAGTTASTNNDAPSSGAVYVFTRSGGTTWSQQAYLKASNTGANDRFGTSVALSGDTLAVGAHLEDSNATGVNGDGANNSSTKSGAVYVFTRSGGAWRRQAYLKASNTGASDRFGYSVALSGGRLAVGADGEAGNATGVNGDEANNSPTESGAVYVRRIAP